VRIVIDTNVLVSGIFWGGIPKRVIEFWRDGHVDLCVTQAVLQEYLRIIEKMGKHDPGLVQEWKDFLSEHALLVDPTVAIALCRDASDNRFLECAAAGRASFLVTGDDDLLSLRNLWTTSIVSPRQFIRNFPDPRA
jgi:putative PIN family toxin of toxin-antitoxin system